MANTIKVKTFDGSSTAANAAMNIYTVPASTTTVVIGLTISNTTLSQITVDIKLSAASTVFLAKDIPIPVGSSVELLSGNKVVLETIDQIRIDCSVADKLSGALSIMEITS